MTTPPGADPVITAFTLAVTNASKSALPLTRAERKTAVLRLLKMTKMSQRQVAGIVGVSKSTVSRWASGEDDFVENDTNVPNGTPSAQGIALALVRRLKRLEESQGLLDSLFGRTLSTHLAQAAVTTFGDDAPAKCETYARWWSEAAHKAAALLKEKGDKQEPGK